MNAENLKVEGVEGFSQEYEEGLMLAQDLMVDFGDEAMVQGSTWINFTRRAKDCNAGPSASRKLPKGVAGSGCASEALGYGWGISKLYQSVEIHLDANDKRQRGSGEGNRFTHKKIN